MNIQWLSSESNRMLVIEGHVDIDAATSAFRLEGGEEFPPAQHVFMRYTNVPDGEEGDWWREVCPADAEGAEPATISVIEY